MYTYIYACIPYDLSFHEGLWLCSEPVRRTTQYASPDFTVVPDRINFPYLQSAHDSTQLRLRMGGYL